MITVRDMMQTELVTVTPDMTVHELARLLAEHDISGAPVLGVDSTVLGVVSATDIIRLAADEADVRLAARPFAAPSDQGDDETNIFDYFQQIRLPLVAAGPASDWATESELDQYVVREIMTPANFHITPDATVRELASFLLRGRIHRALVMEAGMLVGIVTSVDVLRAVADDDS